MIIPMKKLALITIATQADATVEELQRLGVLHLEQHAGSDLGEESRVGPLRERLTRIKKVMFYLGDLKKAAETAPEMGRIPAEDLADRIERIGHIDQEEQRIERLLQDFAGFGDFDPDQIHRLVEKGIDVKLYKANKESLPEVPEGASLVQLGGNSHEVAFIVVSDEPFQIDMQEMVLPDHST